MEVPRDDRFTVSGPVYDGTVCLLAVAGEMDLATSAELGRIVAELLATTPLTRVEFDLSGVTTIDSAGLGALVQARRALKARGVTIAITAPSPVVRRAVEITGLIHFFEHSE